MQDILQRVQRSADGWKLADALLGNPDPQVQFFGALTFTVKLNSDWYARQTTFPFTYASSSSLIQGEPRRRTCVCLVGNSNQLDHSTGIPRVFVHGGQEAMLDTRSLLYPIPRQMDSLHPARHLLFVWSSCIPGRHRYLPANQGIATESNVKTEDHCIVVFCSIPGGSRKSRSKKYQKVGIPWSFHCFERT